MMVQGCRRNISYKKEKDDDLNDEVIKHANSRLNNLNNPSKINIK